MRALKRWTDRLWSTLDSVVGEIEDHDALVRSALDQLQRAEAGARVELGLVQADGADLRERAVRESRAEVDYRERAAVADHEAQALDWLRQARRAAQRRARLEALLSEHTEHQQSLDRHMAKLAERIATLRRQHHVMRTRTAHVEALPPLADTGTEIEEFFDRWDSALSRAEGFGEAGGNDAYEGLLRQEDEAQLRSELAQLRKKGN